MKICHFSFPCNKDTILKSSKSTIKQIQTIISEPLYIFFLSCSGLALIGILWAVIYKIKATSSGVGIIAYNGKVVRAYTPVSGRVTDILVHPGQQVAKGDNLVSIDAFSLETDALASTQVAEITSNLTPTELQANQISTEKKIIATNKSIQLLNSEIKENHFLLKNMKKLVKDSSISYREFLKQQKMTSEMELKVEALRGEADSYKSDLAKIEQAATKIDIDSTAKQRTKDYDFQLSQSINSPIKGIVSLIEANHGKYLKEGDTVAQISYLTGPVKSLFLMSSASATRLKVGDECLVSPSNSPSSDWGYIKGKVTEISDLPTNPDDFERRIGMDYTAKSLYDAIKTMAISKNKPLDLFPFVVTVEIKLDKNNRPEWTLGSRPPWGFKVGNSATVECIYKEWRPINYVIPFFRRQLGFHVID